MSWSHLMIKTVILMVLDISAFAAIENSTYPETIKNLSTNETFVRQFNGYLKLVEEYGKETGPTFTCKPYPKPATQTTSVHKLRPDDVRVVAALGDSITAGSGIKAKTVLGLLLQNRGLSWSIGGDGTIDKVFTLPNIFEVYNANITGFSVGTGNVWQEYISHLNVAHPGDKTEDIPDQAKKLIHRMIHDKNIKYAEDWKIITLFVGGNDLCDFCKDKERYSAERYITHIEKTLDILHQQMPRAFVNLVPVLNITIVKELNANLVCDILHLYLCGCAAFPWSSNMNAELQREIKKYQDYAERLVKSGKYDTRDDFTVVIQPFFTNSKAPRKPDGKADVSYFAPDCFHLSRKGHAEAAKSLWNNMVEPVGQKQTKWSPSALVECPSSAHPYFYTRKNSGDLEGGLKRDQEYGSTGQALMEETGQATNTASKNSSSIGPMSVVAIVCVTGVTLAVAIAVVKWKCIKQRNNERIMLLQDMTVS